MAGPFVGVHHDALIIAGGANFPEAPPWEEGEKFWWDTVYVLENQQSGTLKWLTGQAFRLPRPLAYGVSITTCEGVICIGGSDSKRCYAQVFRLKWNPEKRSIEIDLLPPLPQAAALMSGARVGHTIFVAAGHERMKEVEATGNFWSLDLSKEGTEAFGWIENPTWPGPPRIMPVVGGQSDGTINRLFLFSGRDVGPNRRANMLTDAYCYDVFERSWTTLSDVASNLEVPRSVMGASAATIGNRYLLVFGGADVGVFKELVDIDKAIRKAEDSAQLKELTARQSRLFEEHRGFSRDVLAYDMVMDKWSKVGEFSGPGPAATTAVHWRGGIVIPSGETRPGVRTPNVPQAILSPSETMNHAVGRNVADRRR